MSAALPQPWNFGDGGTRQTHLIRALQRQNDRERLVRETFVNAYQKDPGDWVMDAILVTDWETGEEVLAWSPMDDFEAPSYDGLFVVERVLENE